MRARATFAMLAVLAIAGAAAALWSSGGDGTADLDTADLDTADLDTADLDTADPNTVDPNVDVEDDRAEEGDGAQEPAGDHGDLLVEEPELDGSGTYQLVELRSTPDGVDLRVYRNDSVGGECGATLARVGVSTDLAVGVVEVLVPVDPGQTVVDSRVVGHPEGDRVVVVAGRVGSAITTVSVTMDGLDASDRMVPVDGFVALALHLGDVDDGRVMANLTEADGETHTMHIAEASGRWFATDCPQGLEPPPPETVPSAPATAPTAVERPADRAEIIEIYDFWFNVDLPATDKAGALDDPAGVVELQVSLEQQFGTLLTELVAVVDSISFVSETEAGVDFHIDVPGSSTFEESGRAVLLDGTWRVTRDTVCSLYGVFGLDC